MYGYAVKLANQRRDTFRWRNTQITAVVDIFRKFLIKFSSSTSKANEEAKKEEEARKVKTKKGGESARQLQGKDNCYPEKTLLLLLCYIQEHSIDCCSSVLYKSLYHHI